MLSVVLIVRAGALLGEKFCCAHYSDITQAPHAACSGHKRQSDEERIKNYEKTTNRRS